VGWGVRARRNGDAPATLYLAVCCVVAQPAHGHDFWNSKTQGLFSRRIGPTTLRGLVHPLRLSPHLRQRVFRRDSAPGGGEQHGNRGKVPQQQSGDWALSCRSKHHGKWRFRVGLLDTGSDPGGVRSFTPIPVAQVTMATGYVPTLGITAFTPTIRFRIWPFPIRIPGWLGRILKTLGL
jgi:hypothetical protein